MSPQNFIKEQIKRKCRLFSDDPDIVSGHIENERAVTNDYRGRVLYELLQNAVDRAKNNVWIHIDTQTRSIIVANDGIPFSSRARKGEPRSDLAALCSLHTSNKKAGESIGNKGVGFKSIWEFCHSVQVRTKDDAQCWGLRLRWPFKLSSINDWCDPEAADLVRNALSQTKIEDKHKGFAPSFYFPEYIDSPEWNTQESVTEIVMEDLTEEDFARLVDGPYEELKGAPLAFVGDILPDNMELNLHLCKNLEPEIIKPLYMSCDEWIRLKIDTSNFEDKLNELGEQLGFELEKVQSLALAFPLPGSDKTYYSGLIHSYLPTEIETGSPIHIQGDFYLSESRKNIDFQNNEYNKYLLEIAVDQIIEALKSNYGGICGLPYILSSLLSDGVLCSLLRKKLTGQGELLAKILGQILHAKEVHTLGLFNDIYKVIDIYTPKKNHFYYAHYDKNTLKPYYLSFSKEDLKIVPLSFDKQTGSEDSIITKAIPLPGLDSDNQSTKLFCRKQVGLGSDLGEVKVPGVVVTRWVFPESNGLGRNLKRLSFWTDYEQLSVLRAISRAQKDSSAEEDLINLLRAAMLIAPDIEEYTETQWRFLPEAAHPSQMLRIPIIGGGWQEVRRCYMPDKYSLLKNIIDPEKISLIDEIRCKNIMGNSFRSTLRYWGVWDVIPLILNKKKMWQIPLLNFPTELDSLKLFSDSWKVWGSSKAKRLEPVLKYIASKKWLRVSSGSSLPVSPELVFLGIPNISVNGFYLLNQDELTERERQFLTQLNVFSVETTNDINKLVNATVSVADSCGTGNVIKGGVLSAYRRIIKRINQYVYKGYEVDLSILNKLPIFYEESGRGGRGILTTDQEVLYVPGNYRHVKTRVDSDVLWWLGRGELGTLASKLEKVNSLRSETKINISVESYLDNDLLCRLEKEFLPRFLALACYSDLQGIAEIDEEYIQKRWQGLNVIRVEEAFLLENIYAGDVQVSSNTITASEYILLWEPLRTNQKKNLVLYVSSAVSLDSSEFRKRICTWFAEELFRRQELTRYFSELLDDVMRFTDLGVNDAALDDAKHVVNGWAPDGFIDEIIDEVSNVLGIKIDVTNWLNEEIYSGYNYRELIASLDKRMTPYLIQLNPEEKNIELLSGFLVAHKRNIIALSEICMYDYTQWVDLLKNDECRYKFGFEPRSWLLEKASIDGDKFNALSEKLNADIKELEEDEGVSISLPIGGFLPEAGGTIRYDSGQKNARPPVAFDAKDDVEYADQQLRNSRSGKGVEKCLAIKAAQRISGLDESIQQRCYKLIISEYERLSQLYTTPSLIKEAQVPNSEKSWLDILHMGAKWDGLGYDYIDFDERNKKLLLVEAKSSKRADAVIYFSEPERLSIIRYCSQEFMSEYPDCTWRLFFDANGKVRDVTDLITPEIIAHNEKYKVLSFNIVAENWVFSGVEC